MSAVKQFTTLDVSPDQRARYWNEMAARHYAGSTVDAAYGEFAGQMWSWKIGQMQMLRPRTHACRVTRSPLAENAERLILHLQSRGTGRYSQHGITTRLDPGDAVLCSTAAPYVIDLTQHETLIVEFPRRLLEDRFGPVARRLVTRLPGTSPSLRIFHDFLLSLWQQGYREEHHAGWDTEVSAIFADLLAMALRGADHEDRKGSLPALEQKVRAIVEAQLQEPEFSVGSIARECGLSVRAVQKVFTGMGTTASGYIQARRLERAGEKLLASPELTVTQIAFDHGFNDSAYFTRCFRRHHGVAPSQFRSQH